MSGIENLFNKDALIPNINIAAYFILLYEHFEDVIISTVKDFYSNMVVLDGVAYSSNIDDEYIKALKQKVASNEQDYPIPYTRQLFQAQRDKERYDNEILKNGKTKDRENGGKRLSGSLEWLKNYGVFSEKEIQRIFDIRKRRNEIVHQLLNVLSAGATEEDARMVADLLNYNRRVNNWRFQQIDMPVLGIELPEGASPEDVVGGDDMALVSIFRILFCNEGEAFKKALEEVLGNSAST